MALDVGVELRRGELPIHHVALQLDHVHAVRGEAAHRLVERGGDVADAEDEGGLGVRAARRGAGRIAGHDDEAGGVVPLVLDVAGEDVEPVGVSRQRGGEDALRGGGAGGQFGSGPGAVGGGLCGDAAGIEPGAGLRDEHEMRADVADVGERGSGQAHERDAHADEGLAHDVQAGGREQPVDVGDAAVGGVLHRQHGEVGAAVADGGDAGLEGGAGQGGELGMGPCAGLVGVGAELSLECDAAHWRPLLLPMMRSVAGCNACVRGVKAHR